MNAPTVLPPFTRSKARRTCATLAWGASLLVWLSGCGYMVGNVRAPEVQTVYVPTFTSEGFRRGYEQQLTEAVQKHVQMRGYRLAKPPEADTRLVGHIVAVDKRPVNQNRFDDPRELELALAVTVRWEDARTGQLLSSTEFPIDALGSHAVTQTTFAPETGQSLATGSQEAVDTLARRIVEMMEVPW
ncbi:MAG: LptE family protein [Planctomycetaceae bacterium]|nr:LptE family protein [Planctomycetaceae bacterium]